MIYGYTRVSTEEQNPDLQINALRQYGVQEIFSDKISGATLSRPGLDDLLSQIREGDVVVVWRLDRLGRSVRHLLDTAEAFRTKGVTLRSITDGVDTNGPMGSFLLTILGVPPADCETPI